MINLAEAFEKFSKDSFKFHLVENPIYPRPDICALMLLDKLAPPEDRYMISDLWHGEVFLNVDCETLANNATEQDIQTLVRCGIDYDKTDETLFLIR